MIQKIYVSLGILLLTVIQVKAQICQEDVTVTNGTVTGSQTIQASNSITAIGTNTITANATVQYRAGLEITLSPNYDVLNGASFDAYLGPCVGPPYNDTYIANQWGHYNIIQSLTDFNGVPISNPGHGSDIFGAWEITNGSSDITVAIIDSGVDADHIDIDHTRFIHGYNFVNDNPDYNDMLGHGTLVTGILGATTNNNIGVAGIDWNCNIMPLKAIPDGGGLDPGDIIDEAVNYAVSNGANIISMSFGRSTKQSFDVENSYSNAIDNNVLLFAATGNDNRSGADYPARYSSIAGVGALSPCDERKSSTSDGDGGSCDQDNRGDLGITNWGSNYGDGLNFLAPGTLLPSTDIMGSEGYSQYDIYESVENGNYILDTYGTSMSSPFAAGIAALVWSVNENLKNYQVLHIMQETARDIAPNNPNEWDEETGYGALNAKAAVEMAQTFNPATDFLLPNLALQIVNASSTVTYDGNLQISLRVQNTGDVLAQSSQLTYRISGPFSGTGNLISNIINIEALNPGEFVTRIITIPVSCANNFTSGDYTLSFEIDANNNVQEFNEFNTYQHEFEVIGLPDLIIENQILTYDENSNEYSVTYNVRNVGISAAYFEGYILPIFSFYKYYASADDQLDINDSFIANENVTGYNLCPGDSESKIQDGLVITDSNANFLLIQIDSGENIDEGSNESNNVVAIDLNQFNSYKPKNKTDKDTVSIDSSIVIELIPNPIEDRGVIRYNLESESTVSVSIYDMTGLTTKTVLADVKQSKGIYEIPVFKSDFRTGMYFIEINIDGERYLQRMIIK